LLEGFSTAPVQANDPAGAGQFRTWYDATNTAFASVAASTLNGSPAMNILDGGFANGVYAIYNNAIPETGTYQLVVSVDVTEVAAGLNGIRAYQIGAAVGAGAVHRGVNPSAVAPLPISGTYLGLTAGDDTALPIQTVVTGQFTATAGDPILIGFGTDVVSGTWAQNSGTWSTSFVTVDNIILRKIYVEPPPSQVIVDNDEGSPAFTTTGSWTLSGTTGYNGGTYVFATAGSPATATWNATLPEAGFYEVAVQYRAGTNRALSADYEVTTAEGTKTARIDQTLNSLTWVTIGEYSFDAGPASVTLLSEGSLPAGAVLIADAVRFLESDGPPPIDPPEMRVAQVLVFDTINSAAAIQNWVDQIVAARYNAIAVHARYRGDATYFPNKTDSTFPNIEPRSPAAGSIDVIEEFVTRGHEAGLKVFAYVNSHLVTDGADTDPRPEHVINQHPDWITYQRNGGSPIQQTVALEQDGLWLEASLPEVQTYLTGICADIILNYDVDGIVLDRMRYPDTTFDRTTADFGYHPYAIAEFNAQYGKTGVPSATDPDWILYRQENITRTVQKIYNTMHAIEPEAILLSFPIGRLEDAVPFEYQNWPNWMAREVIDGTIPQIYTSSNATFSSRVSAALGAYNGPRLLGATLDGFRTGTDIVGQVGIARTLGFDGTSIFYHSRLGPLGYTDDLAIAYNGIAPFPETPWKSQPFECEGVTIRGTSADESVSSTPCSEVITLAGGTDTVTFSGPQANYAICANLDGSLTITDTTGADGTDVVVDAEILTFSDASELVANLTPAACP